MIATPRRDTPCELELRRALHGFGLRYRVDCRLPMTRRRADIVFARERVAVFVDGCFWHGCPAHMTWPTANAPWWRAKIHANTQRDRDTDARLRALGWRVLRFWEHQAMPTAAKRVLHVVLLRRRAHQARHVLR